MTTSATLLILGGAGDLAERLLIPGAATYLSAHRDRFPDRTIDLQIIGVGRADVTEYPDLVRRAVTENSVAENRAALAEELAADARYFSADATDPADLARLVAEVDPDRRLILYYGLPPEVTGTSIDALASVDLPEDAVLAVEKPLGTDAASAAELEKSLATIVDEDHLYRVDHFLQESAVTSLLGLFALNRPLLDTFSAESVERIDVVYDETLALEGRADFYDSTGAARDMLQSHLLQVATHLLATGGRDSVAELLSATTADPAHAGRARYTAGAIDGHDIPSYVDEEGVEAERGTETLARVELAVDTDRWRGVPVTLRSGKAIGDPRQTIDITYRTPEGWAGESTAGETVTADRTRIIVGFDDRLTVNLSATAGQGVAAAESLVFSTALREGDLTPYARVVRALVTGDHRREVPAGTAELAWAVLQPVLDAFEEGRVPLEDYPAGSAGPTAWDNPGSMG